MEIIEDTGFEGLLIIKPDVYYDNRGYFFESYNRKSIDKFNIETEFLQHNVSKSSRNTIRGLHFQKGVHAQGKLCQVLHGSVIDIALDIRINSPTFGKHYSLELSEDNHLQLWIPVGFAHGFSVLTDEAVFGYKCTNYFNAESERIILYRDPDLEIDWKVENPAVSDKDAAAQPFKELFSEFFFAVSA